MQLISAEIERLRRLYVWSLEEAKHEYESDLKVIRSIYDSSSIAALEYLSEMDSESQLKYMQSMIKLNHTVGMLENGENISKEEFEIAKMLRNKIIVRSQALRTKLLCQIEYDPRPTTTILKRRLKQVLFEETAVKPVKAGPQTTSTVVLNDWHADIGFNCSHGWHQFNIKMVRADYNATRIGAAISLA